MSDCLFRVSGTHFDVNSFLAQSKFKPFKVWYKGEPFANMKEGVSKVSGFGVQVSKKKSKTLSDQVADAQIFINKYDKELSLLHKFMGVEEMVLDFAVFQGPYRPKSIHFPSSFLQTAAKFNIELQVSTYPVPK